MSEKKYADDDSERTLVTLDQLSQTIEVMTSVVNRLRRHLSDQIKYQIEAQEELEALAAVPIEASAHKATSKPDTEATTPESQQVSSEQDRAREQQRESFVVEISQQEVEPTRKPTKTLH
jgi:hypothetical protein